jgi:hypothetical protein
MIELIDLLEDLESKRGKVTECILLELTLKKILL